MQSFRLNGSIHSSAPNTATFNTRNAENAAGFHAAGRRGRQSAVDTVRAEHQHPQPTAVQRCLQGQPGA